MKPSFRSNASAIVVATTVLAVLMAGCKKSDDSVTPDPEPMIQLATSATLGQYLADSAGNTLYFFTRDVDGTNNCTSGNCQAAWPIYHKANVTQARLGTGLLLADFAEITTGNGAKQLTYKGWPLYYYAPAVNGANTRELPGETKGEGIGSVWYVAKTDYTIMLANRQLVGENEKKYKRDYTEGEEVTQYFTDGKGSTLYAFVADKKNKNNCLSVDCKAAWPVFAETLISIPSTLDKALFGTIDVDGKKQVTYKGWPLYYFFKDAKRGENKGVSYPKPGIWPVVNKDTPEAPAN